MTAETLKLKLTQIKRDNYVINCENLYYSYALDMLKHIGTTDKTLRDDLIYDVFAKWINQNRFTTQQIQTFLAICIDNQHLMKCVGAENDDTVFTRTFSALIIALILYSHNQKKFLPHNVIVETKNLIIEYYTKEMDLRGYIDNKGWAHSAAHGADVIDELAQCTVLCKEDLQRLLMILQLKICQGKYVYIDGEPDRISVAVRSIFMRNEIDEYDIVLWLESFKKYNSTSNSSIEWYHQKINITNFLKSLYFTLKVCIQDFIIVDKIQDLITTLYGGVL
ncbi:DUF2785 domain-containing protein [Clostridium sp. BSD9I1]|uniref:DUF2785 domain-containing protein n=1 Tax=Clostridium sp. BSD9I1 TaxID=2003589 RepID=UPI001645A7A6|nr:DUF2785 domain-containing protein [Clostridium sp. BSD9I1]